ncbi:MAG: response regulator [Acidimicrobiales bacterium]
MSTRTQDTTTNRTAHRGHRDGDRNGRRLEIVMVDDDHNDHLLMSMAAEAAGLDADFVFHDDGTTLLHRLEKLTSLEALPDLILLDLRMPGLDGHRTLEALQRHDTLWQIPVIVFTSSTRKVDETAAFANGAHWFEMKPSEFSGMVDFAEKLPERANHLPYRPPVSLEPVIDLTISEDELFAQIEDVLSSHDGWLT